MVLISVFQEEPSKAPAEDESDPHQVLPENERTEVSEPNDSEEQAQGPFLTLSKDEILGKVRSQKHQIEG